MSNAASYYEASSTRYRTSLDLLLSNIPALVGVYVSAKSLQKKQDLRFERPYTLPVHVASALNLAGNYVLLCSREAALEQRFRDKTALRNRNSVDDTVVYPLTDVAVLVPYIVLEIRQLRSGITPFRKYELLPHGKIYVASRLIYHSLASTAALIEIYDRRESWVPEFKKDIHNIRQNLSPVGNEIVRQYVDVVMSPRPAEAFVRGIVDSAKLVLYIMSHARFTKSIRRRLSRHL